MKKETDKIIDKTPKSDVIFKILFVRPEVESW